MKTNVSDIIEILEKEKCSFHKYRAMVFEENGEFKIIGCCKSFEIHLEVKGKQMVKNQVYENDETN